jgi:hypothetical protein
MELLMRALRRTTIAAVSTIGALLGSTFVRAPAAHADCLMIGHPDLGAAPALLNNPASQGNCNGSFRMFGYIEDHSSDSRTAKVKAQGIRADGSVAWTRNAQASGAGKSTHFDWTNSRVHHVKVTVWAENTWGTSTFYYATYTGAAQ